MCETEKLSIYLSFLFTYNIKEIKFTNKKLNLKKMLHRWNLFSVVSISGTGDVK